MTNRLETVCYVGGCGRLGLSMAAWVAEMGYRVICADISREAVQKVNEGISPISEPRVAELLARHAGRRLSATTDTEAAALESNLIFVVTPTPSEPGGAFSLEHIFAACAPLGSALSKIGDYRLVAIVSTVMPGHTGGPIRKRLEATSGKRAGRDFGLAYSPSFIRQGSIVADFTCPDLVLIGELDRRSGDTAERFYRTVVANDPPFHRMGLASAEIAKLGLNACIVQKMAMSAQITWLCQNSPGADASDVLAAVASDSRIGRPYFERILWPGGPCFPRDCRAFACASEGAGVAATLACAAQKYLSTQADYAAGLIHRIAAGRKVGILGLTYKEEVDSTEESPALAILERLKALGDFVFVHDPHVQDTSELREVLDCDVIVVATAHRQFFGLGPELTEKTVIDLRRIFEDQGIRDYVRLGRA